MSHEILSAKLSQLNHKIAMLHLRIRKCKALDQAELLREINQLNNEYLEAEKQLQNVLQQSHSPITAILSHSYENMLSTAKETTAKIADINKTASNNENIAESKLLLAEYALDFAMQAAEHALLISLEAMAAQYPEEIETGESSCMK